MVRQVFFGGGQANRLPTDWSLVIIRITIGLPMMTVFEKLFPRDGVWGPQQWFVDGVAAMGFPIPLFFPGARF